VLEDWPVKYISEEFTQNYYINLADTPHVQSDKLIQTLASLLFGMKHADFVDSLNGEDVQWLNSQQKIQNLATDSVKRMDHRLVQILLNDQATLEELAGGEGEYKLGESDQGESEPDDCHKNCLDFSDVEVEADDLQRSKNS